MKCKFAHRLIKGVLDLSFPVRKFIRDHPINGDFFLWTLQLHHSQTLITMI